MIWGSSVLVRFAPLHVSLFLFGLYTCNLPLSCVVSFFSFFLLLFFLSRCFPSQPGLVVLSAKVCKDAETRDSHGVHGGRAARAFPR